MLGAELDAMLDAELGAVLCWLGAELDAMLGSELGAVLCYAEC